MNIVTEKTKYHRFALYYDYHPERVHFCQDIRDSFGWQKFSYDSSGGLKRWVFSDSLFVSVIKERFPEAQIEPDVESIMLTEQVWMQKQKKMAATIDQVKERKTTDFHVPGLKGKMYDYQRVGTEFFVASGGRAINADIPGAGKSVQSLAYIKYMGFKRTLIVCPASVKFVWKTEVEKWTNLSCIIIDGQTEVSNIDPKIAIWVINYDILAKHLVQLGKIRFDCIIGDEATYIKSIVARRSKAFRIIARNIASVILLSGTPLLSRPVELFTLLNIIDPQTWNNYYDFVRRYCGAHQTRYGLDVSGASHIDELHARIKRYFIRRTKDDILTELPPKQFTDIPIELNGEYKQQYETAASDFAKYLRAYSGKQPLEIARSLEAEKLVKLNILRQLNALGKVPMAAELIENIIETGDKILVFSSFVKPLELLKKHFGDQAVVLTGQTPIEERKNVVHAFQTDDKIKVFLGGIKSAGLGITLTAASNVLFLDFSWNPADHQQAQDRVHRPGQIADSINIYQLYAMDTIDEDLRELLRYKQNIFDRVIDGKEATPRAKEAMDAAIKRVLKNY